MGIERQAPGDLGGEVSNYIYKNRDNFGEELSQIEGWARENTEEARQKLLAKAREHGIDVSDKANIGEVKNKIKAYLRTKS